MIVIKVNYTTDQPIIKVNYDDAPIYISTTVDATYIKVDYGTGGGAGGTIWGDIIGTLSDQLDLQAALDAKVPYTGATANVDLGEYELKAGQIELDQSPTGTAGVAVTRWNDAIGSTETTLKGGNVVLKNGVDLVARVVNKVTPNTTLTKAAYQAVKVSGAQGQRLAIALAQANNDNNSADTLGIVTETIPTNQEGFIMTVGSLEGINTTGSLQGETWSDGDVLYLSPTTAGAITNIKPNGSTGHIVVIGYVEYAHANNGKIYIKIMNGWELSELHDTFISSPANNDALIYESSTSLWKNKSIATALGYTPGTVSSVALTVPTGLVVTSGSPITTSGTIAVGLQSGYSIPTTVKQSNWDDAYTFVSAFPTQSGNSGKYLTTDGSTLSWGTVSIANIYNSDGTLSGNRTVGLGGNKLSIGTATTSFVAGQLELGVNNLGASFVIHNTNVSGSGSIVYGAYSRYMQIGIASPSLAFPVNGGAFIHNPYANLYFTGGGSAQPSTGDVIMTLFQSTKNITIGGTTDAGYKLDVQGTGRFTGNLTADALYSSLTYLYLGTSNGTIYQIGTSDDFQRIKASSGYLVYQYGGSGLSLGSYGAYWDNTNFRLSISAASTPRMFFHGTSLNVTVGTATDSASSLFSINSTTQGFLQPRMTGTQRDAIVSPATGLSVYNTTTNTSDFYNGTSWVSLAAGNIYTADGTLTGNRTVTMGSFTLSFTRDILVNGLTIGKGGGNANNTAVGVDALVANTTGFGNSAFGIQSGRFLSTGLYNSAFGLESLRSSTAGTANSAFGYATLYSSQGNRNTSFGSTSFYSLSSGNDNTSIGNNSGRYLTDGVTGNTTCNTSIFIGAETKALANNQTNQIVIGYNSTGLGSNTTVIGNSSTTDTAIYGRMLVNYATPVIGTYALDVNGTGRFNAATSGSTNYTLSVLDSNGNIGSSILVKYASSHGFIYNTRLNGMRLYNENSTVFLSCVNSSGNVNIGADENSDRSRLQVVVNSQLTNNDGITITDNTSSASSFSALTWHQLYSNKLTGRIKLNIGSLGNVPNLIFEIASSGTLNEAMRIFSSTNIGVNSGSTDISSAQLFVNSTTKGFLPPRMTSAERAAISTPATGLIVYQTDGTEGLYERTSTAWRIINASGGGGGITRSVNNISTTTTAAAAANTDYVYLISGTTTLTLPTAAGNTNRYTLKNVGTNTVTINTTSSQTIDGSTSITMAVQYTALDVISDGTNWNII